MLELISDLLLAAGAFGAALYCYVLAGRLRKFQTLETGMGGAIAVLSAQVDEMTRALELARSAATTSADGLEGLTLRAEAVAGRLELMMAAMHDLPGPSAADSSGASRHGRILRRRRAGAPEEAETIE